MLKEPCLVAGTKPGSFWATSSAWCSILLMYCWIEIWVEGFVWVVFIFFSVFLLAFSFSHSQWLWVYSWLCWGIIPRGTLGPWCRIWKLAGHIQGKCPGYSNSIVPHFHFYCFKTYLNSFTGNAVIFHIIIFLWFFFYPGLNWHLNISNKKYHYIYKPLVLRYITINNAMIIIFNLSFTFM